MNSVCWKSPSNIALVKYWGKKGIQIPLNPSISFTLEKSYTQTEIMWQHNSANDIQIKFLFEGQQNQAFEKRVSSFISQVVGYIPAIKGLSLEINSHNSFPHSSGIASSASAMSALALCLVDIEQQLTGKQHFIDDFYAKSSFIARLGSGSAARSIYKGINLWGKVNGVVNSSDDYAIDISDQCHDSFKNYGDAILIVSDKTKKVSSSAGHGLMNNHPFAQSKFSQSYINTNLLLSILENGDLDAFALLIEEEALSLHAMMMTSNPSFLLMEPNTLEIISAIKNFRIETKIPVCFTLDAGANVHFLYPGNHKIAVKEFICSNLIKYCNQEKWIDDKVGIGAVRILQSMKGKI